MQVKGKEKVYDCDYVLCKMYLMFISLLHSTQNFWMSPEWNNSKTELNETSHHHMFLNCWRRRRNHNHTQFYVLKHISMYETSSSSSAFCLKIIKPTIDISKCLLIPNNAWCRRRLRSEKQATFYEFLPFSVFYI